MTKNVHGKTASGRSITDELVGDLARAAVDGYDVDETLRRRGRPPMGSGPASVESVRLEPELRDALAERAKRDRATTSAVIRDALRAYLGTGGHAGERSDDPQREARHAP